MTLKLLLHVKAIMQRSDIIKNQKKNKNYLIEFGQLKYNLR